MGVERHDVASRMFEHDGVAVVLHDAGRPDNTVCRGVHRRSVSSAISSPLMERLLAGDRIYAIPELGRDLPPRGFNGWIPGPEAAHPFDH